MGNCVQFWLQSVMRQKKKEREIAQDRNLRNALAAAEHANRAKNCVSE